MLRVCRGARLPMDAQDTQDTQDAQDTCSVMINLSRPSQGVCRRACYLSVLCCLVLSVESACVRAVPGLDPDQIQDAAHAECRYACRVQVYYKYACFSLCVCLCKQDANTHADLVIIFAVGRGFGASLVFSGLSGLAFACFPAGFCRFLSRVCVVRVCAMAGQIHESMSSAPALPLRLWVRVVLPALYCQRCIASAYAQHRCFGEESMCMSFPPCC